MWVVKLAASQFISFCSNVAETSCTFFVARFSVPLGPMIRSIRHPASVEHTYRREEWREGYLRDEILPVLFYS